MSLILRSLLRDPLLTRPLSRAIRRYDDDLWHESWPVKRIRRMEPYESPVDLMEDMSRQMASTMSRMQEFVDDLDALDSWASRQDKASSKQSKRSQRRDDMLLKRTESGGLQLALDVTDFKPENLKIKLVDDNLVVEALSETSGKDSYRRNHFKRWFKLPEDCKLEDIRSKLTPDNRLVIDLPTTRPVESEKSRSIPIEVEKPALGSNGDQPQAGENSADQNQQSSSSQ